jgi:hypothetical protein
MKFLSCGLDSYRDHRYGSKTINSIFDFSPQILFKSDKFYSGYRPDNSCGLDSFRVHRYGSKIINSILGSFCVRRYGSEVINSTPVTDRITAAVWILSASTGTVST